MLRTTEVPYVYARDGIYYFTRRIPKDLRGHYRCPRIVPSLRTKSLSAAKTKSVTLVAQLDEEWMTLRWRSKDSPLRRYLSDQAFVVRELSDAPLMSEAKDIYLRAKGQGRPGTFAQAVARAIGNLIGTIRALVNFVTRELGLSDVSAFSGIYLGDDNHQAETKRQPITDNLHPVCPKRMPTYQ